jgi:hypothetical protein
LARHRFVATFSGTMSAPAPTLLDLVPSRVHRFETAADGRVTVLVPKFTSRFARRWFVPLLAKPDLRVHLDAVGSFVWGQCDGTATIREIGERVAARFGGAAPTRRQDVVRFVHKLVKEESLSFQPPGEPAETTRGRAPDAPTA